MSVSVHGRSMQKLKRKRLLEKKQRDKSRIREKIKREQSKLKERIKKIKHEKR